MPFKARLFNLNDLFTDMIKEYYIIPTAKLELTADYTCLSLLFLQYEYRLTWFDFGK